jgi:hypothetical protein
MRGSKVISAGAISIATLLALARAEAATADGGAGAVEAVALPEQAACTIRALNWLRTLRLELAPGVPYVEIDSSDAADVVVPIAGAPMRVGVKLRRRNVILAGLVPAAAVPLRAARSFTVGEVFLPMPSTELHWTDATAGELGVEVRLQDSTLKVVKGVARRLRTRRPCGDLALEAGASFKAYEAVGGRGLDGDGRLKTSGPVPISATPGAAPLVRLVPSRELSEAITVLRREPEWTRIGVLLDDVILFGWVPESFVLPPPPKKGRDVSGFGQLGLAGIGPFETKDTAFRCTRDVRLLAEAGGQRRAVGTVEAGAAMEVAPGDGEFAFLTVDGLKPVKGAKFLVRRTELEGCKNAPAP